MMKLKGEEHSPAKESPEGKGGRKQLAIMEAIDHTKGIRHWRSQALAEPIQVLLVCTRPEQECQSLTPQLFPSADIADLCCI